MDKRNIKNEKGTLYTEYFIERFSAEIEGFLQVPVTFFVFYANKVLTLSEF